jgi:hypothetical protein
MEWQSSQETKWEEQRFEFTAVKPCSSVVLCCGRIPTFQRSMLPPSSGWRVEMEAAWLSRRRRFKLRSSWVVTPCSIVVGY